MYVACVFAIVWSLLSSQHNNKTPISCVCALEIGCARERILPRDVAVVRAAGWCELFNEMSLDSRFDSRRHRCSLDAWVGRLFSSPVVDGES